MSGSSTVVVVGAGVGGLCAAIALKTARPELRLVMLEARAQAGGKLGVASADGVEFDTGPSVLTLPEVFDDVFARAGRSFRAECELLQPEPFFEYVYPWNRRIRVYADWRRTLESVASALGREAASELEAFGRYAARIWESSSPHFVYGPAPSLGRVLTLGVRHFKDVMAIDALKSMRQAIETQVHTRELRWLLARYATYNGSDYRSAPATLNTIAHVELERGVYGVRGGMYSIVRALERVALAIGIELRSGCPVARIVVGTERRRWVGSRYQIEGVELANGERISTRTVIANADARHVFGRLWGVDTTPRDVTRALAEPVAMSGWVGVLRGRWSRAASDPVAAHTVVFPSDYDAEFADIFDRKRMPQDPTLYVCDQTLSHARTGWPDGSRPVFVMMNAPAVKTGATPVARPELQSNALMRLRSIGLEGEWVFERGPEGLEALFPESMGSIYGASSNSMSSAFARLGNSLEEVGGLYLASGSVHPGGGVPLCALSGLRAAEGAARSA